MRATPSPIGNVNALKRSLEAVSQTGDIVVEKNGDYSIDNEECLPFEYKAVLGKGGSAFVQKVQHKTTRAVFANKVFAFPREKAKGRDQAVGRYYNELAIIRSLKAHRHMIELFATYRTPRSGALILCPAADQGDLQQYLDNYADALDDHTTASASVARMTKVLEQAFGCLLSGLSYMHGMGVRHKDIKPANILIHKGTVIYTDFGTSKDTVREQECTTEGRPDFLTRKYSAPEVLEYEKRNFAADVFSLGCVFFEILLRLSGMTEHEGLGADGYSGIIDALHTLLLSAEIPSKLSCLRAIVIAMTLREAKGRPDSAKITTDICSHEGLSCLPCHFSKAQVQPRPLQPSAPHPPNPESPTPGPPMPETSTPRPTNSQHSMSGLELAGAILGAFPLLLSGIEHWRDVATVHDLYRHIRKHYKKCQRDIQFHEIIYKNNLRELLVPLTESADEVARLVADPGGQGWGDKALQERLKGRLNDSYELYLRIITEMNDVVEEFNREICFDKENVQGGLSLSEQKGQRRNRSPSLQAFSKASKIPVPKGNQKSEMFCMKFSLGERKRNELVDKLKECNERLEKLVRSGDR